MKINRKVRLRVEELESRFVPSAGTPWPYPTGNWSGYSIDTAAGAVTDVKGSWNVPSVSILPGTKTYYAASWLGIDGDISNTVEQIGTDSDQIGGKAYYYAWYEMYPSNYYYINWATGTGIPASSKVPSASLLYGAADTISADVKFLSVSGSVSTFQLSITDTSADGTKTRSFTTTQTIKNAARSSAEWIVEQTGPLTNFGSETFTGAQATIGTKTGTIGDFYHGDSSTVVYKMDIVNRQGISLDRTDDGGIAGGSFTVYYGATLPSSASGGAGTRGPVERLADITGSNGAVVEISPATPTDAVLANSIVQPCFHVVFSQGEGTLGRSNVVVAGMAIGEGNPGASLSYFGLPLGSGMAVPPAVKTVQGRAMAGGVRFESSLEPFAEPFSTGSSPFEQDAIASPPTLAFSEDVHIDRLIGALALVAFLPSQMSPKAKEEPARVRRLPGGNGQPE